MTIGYFPIELGVDVGAGISVKFSRFRLPRAFESDLSLETCNACRLFRTLVTVTGLCFCEKEESLRMGTVGSLQLAV